MNDSNSVKSTYLESILRDFKEKNVPSIAEMMYLRGANFQLQSYDKKLYLFHDPFVKELLAIITKNNYPNEDRFFVDYTDEEKWAYYDPFYDNSEQTYDYSQEEEHISKEQLATMDFDNDFVAYDYSLLNPSLDLEFTKMAYIYNDNKRAILAYYYCVILLENDVFTNIDIKYILLKYIYKNYNLLLSFKTKQIKNDRDTKEIEELISKVENVIEDNSDILDKVEIGISERVSISEQSQKQAKREYIFLSEDKKHIEIKHGYTSAFGLALNNIKGGVYKAIKWIENNSDIFNSKSKTLTDGSFYKRDANFKDENIINKAKEIEEEVKNIIEYFDKKSK